jgi:hypothetical protein
MTKRTASTSRTARKGLAIAALAVVAGLGLTPSHASAEEPKKNPAPTTPAPKPPKEPYLVVVLEDVLISSW